MDLNCNNLKVILDRFDKGEKQTLGFLMVLISNELKLKLCTLELPWLENQKRISCFPVGIYPVEKRYSAKYGWHFHIKDVPNRDFILIHVANFVRQLLGCVAVGLKHTDIDGDGLRDVTSSRKAMDLLLKILPDKFEIEIK